MYLFRIQTIQAFSTFGLTFWTVCVGCRKFALQSNDFSDQNEEPCKIECQIIHLYSSFMLYSYSLFLLRLIGSTMFGATFNLVKRVGLP